MLLDAKADPTVANKYRAHRAPPRGGGGHADATAALITAVKRTPDGLAAKARDGATPLHAAAAAGHAAVVRQLVAAGAPDDARDLSGQTPLMVAAAQDRAAAVEALCGEDFGKHHARGGEFTLDGEFTHGSKGITVAKEPAAEGEEPPAEGEEAPAAPTPSALLELVDDNEWTALHHALDTGSYAACRSLLALGASVDAVTKGKRTCAMLGAALLAELEQEKLDAAAAAEAAELAAKEAEEEAARRAELGLVAGE